MDPAQVIELQAKRHHKPMEELIDRGDSPVQLYYRGTTVFITGGSGFLGKQLVEKLLRSCEIKKIYLLTRSRKGKTIQERLIHILQEAVFDRLREIQPNFADKIVPIEGDVADIRLGLSDADWNKLTKEVNIIFHVAATVRFDEHLRKAIFTNVRGTREALTLAKDCSNFMRYVHVSTAFSHATYEHIDDDLEEQFYPCPVSAKTMISLAEEVDHQRLDDISKDLIQGWPNTYTFTKAIAEELVRSTSGDLPVCVIRPSIVLPSYFEPNPGWLDKHTVIGPSGVYLGSGIGLLHVFLTDVNANLAMAPVDYVNNTTIAAAWDSTEREKNGQTDIPIYNIARDLRYGLIGETMRTEKKSYCSNTSIWYCESFETKSKFLFFILSWFYHYIPAYCADFVLKILGKKLPQGIGSIVDVYKKIDKLADIYNYFITNQFNFKDSNVRAMIGRMNEADKFIYNCDLSNIDFKEYILVWGIGLRKYILGEKLTDTAAGYRKQQILFVVHYIVVAIYLYVLWLIFSTAFMLIKNVFFFFL